MIDCSVLLSGLTNGLSRMRGDSHVRFLGGGGAAMRCCYPTLVWMPSRASCIRSSARRPTSLT
ncbi:hypothetical protein A8H39_01550 [Paraburkholderia fungorum]|nr:hypothetical protein A8H39_01550 [Paraburkholderia fungorum]